MINYLLKVCKDLSTFNAQEARINSSNITDKIAKEQLKRVLIFTKANSLKGKNKVEYGWFHSPENGEPLERLDKLHPEVVDELINRGFTVGPPQNLERYNYMLEGYMEYITHEISW